MGTSLTGTKPKDTYDSLIKVGDNGPLSGSLKTLTDGLGNDSALGLSSRGLKVNQSDTLITDTASICHFSNNFLYVRGGTAGLVLGDDGLSNRIQFDDNGAVVFEAGGVERLRITAAGIVGINDISSGSVASNYAPRLLVGGPIIARSLTTNESLVAIGSDATSAYVSVGKQDGTLTGRDLRFVRGTTEIMRVTAGGITFNGDTAAANALDDYEQGTFTPTNAGDATGVVSSATGTYTKIGNVVHFRMVVGIDTNFTSNAIGGLPYTVSGGGSSSLYGGMIMYNDSDSDLTATLNASTTVILIYSGSDTSAPTSPTSPMGFLRISGTYFVS